MQQIADQDFVVEVQGFPHPVPFKVGGRQGNVSDVLSYMGDDLNVIMGCRQYGARFLQCWPVRFAILAYVPKIASLFEHIVL